MQRLPASIPRCLGVRDGETVRPHQHCQGCLRWLSSDDHAPRFVAAPGVLTDAGTVQCDQRIAQGA